MYRAFVALPDGRRVLVTDTITILEPGDAGAVVVSGSHGGTSSAQFVKGRGLAAVFYNDAGIGQNRAGIRALDELDGIGLPALAVAHDSARIGDGRDTWDHGRVSHANAAALAAGAAPGMTVQAAALALRPVAVPGGRMEEPVLNRREVPLGGGSLLVLDSVSMLREGDRGRFVLTGSHGGAVSGEFALRHRPALVVFNDAGGGRDDAGRAALPRLEAAGIAALAVDAATGEIGHPLHMLDHGVVSAANAAARELGMGTGALKPQLAALLAQPSRINGK
jgi:hypothetical protein